MTNIEEQFGHNIYKLIFDHSPEAIVLLDPGGRFVAANGRLNDWLGVSAEDHIGKNILEVSFLSVKSKAIVAEKFAERMLGGDMPAYELEFIDKEGKTKIGRIIGTPIKDSTGKVLGDLVMISEVTELKKAEDELKEKVDELARLNSLMVDRELKMIELKKKLESNNS
jgi:PAS domain S-box-containing protein